MTGPLRKTRYLGHFLVILAGIFLLAESVVLVHQSHLTTIAVLGLILGFGLIVWHFLRFSKTLRRDVRHFVVLKSETGSVRVHASAVEEALRRTAKTLPEVHDVKIRLVLDPQSSVPTEGRVEARISDITNIVTVHDALSKVLIERYQQIIPGAPPIDFHLTIKHHIKPPGKPKDRKKKKIVPPEEDETKAIRAPQYPVPK